MLNFSLLRSIRFNPTRLINVASLCTKKDKFSSESSQSSSSDDEKHVNRTAVKKRSEDAREKLNLLLEKMVQDDSGGGKKPSLQLARARDHRKRDMRKEPGTKSVKKVPVGKAVVQAVQDVAQELGGNVKQTESELLQKLLNPVKEEPAETLSLSDLFKDMKIDREVKKDNASRADQVRQVLKKAESSSKAPVLKRKPARQSADTVPVKEHVNLHVQDRLGIFNPEEVNSWPDVCLNKTWETLHRRELQLSVTHPPANYFQQMILWTNQGKIWKFPIDNEQDLDEEKKVYFTEHIFLEKHLEGWCPSKGPIRHFMELVCVGLSKNPYLTVQMKKEHIEWFRDYFREKKQLLTEVGAFPPGFDIEQGVQKKIE